MNSSLGGILLPVGQDTSGTPSCTCSSVLEPYCTRCYGRNGRKWRKLISVHLHTCLLLLSALPTRLWPRPFLISVIPESPPQAFMYLLALPGILFPPLFAWETTSHPLSLWESMAPSLIALMVPIIFLHNRVVIKVLKC